MQILLSFYHQFTVAFRDWAFPIDYSCFGNSAVRTNSTGKKTDVFSHILFYSIENTFVSKWGPIYSRIHERKQNVCLLKQKG